MPLYTALLALPLSELSTFRMALVMLVGGFAPGFQPEIVPSSVANRKIAGWDGATWKS
ncbi:MAG TPA: hypothetical protein VHM93_09285 [Candidatus Acidoferrum sp.]|jgi:hypothetical protein|nr:hypothetical protein [Candidatus Acidoferrum sp.]